MEANCYSLTWCFFIFILLSFKDLDIQYGTELTQGPEVDRVKVVSQCYSSIEASSNSADIHRMTNGETMSYWQSDGSARSHWIRHGGFLQFKT